MGDISVKVVFDRTFDLKRAFGTAPRRLIKKLCFDTEAEAKQNTPVDTGALRASIYTSLPDGSTYEQAASEARDKGSKPGRSGRARGKAPVILPEAKPEGPLEGVVAVGVEYGAYVELGSVRAPARPYLLPAAEKVSAEAVKAAEQTWTEEIGKL